MVPRRELESVPEGRKEHAFRLSMPTDSAGEVRASQPHAAFAGTPCPMVIAAGRPSLAWAVSCSRASSSTGEPLRSGPQGVYVKRGQDYGSIRPSGLALDE